MYGFKLNLTATVENDDLVIQSDMPYNKNLHRKEWVF